MFQTIQLADAHTLESKDADVIDGWETRSFTNLGLSHVEPAWVNELKSKPIKNLKPPEVISFPLIVQFHAVFQFVNPIPVNALVFIAHPLPPAIVIFPVVIVALPKAVKLVELKLVTVVLGPFKLADNTFIELVGIKELFVKLW